MEQSRIGSVIETIVNIGTGFILSWCAWLWVLPLIYPEHASSARTAFGITVFFTVLSLTRNYFWRRFFARGIHKAIYDNFITK